MNYFLIGDEDALLGFSMVGVEGQLARNAKEASQALESALANPSIGIVLICEGIAEWIRSEVDAFIFKRDFPLILEIPDRKGILEPRNSLRETVNEAIGIKL